jgi:hypothetical protein
LQFQAVNRNKAAILLHKKAVSLEKDPCFQLSELQASSWRENDLSNLSQPLCKTIMADTELI